MVWITVIPSHFFRHYYFFLIFIIRIFWLWSAPAISILLLLNWLQNSWPNYKKSYRSLICTFFFTWTRKIYFLFSMLWQDNWQTNNTSENSSNCFCSMKILSQFDKCYTRHKSNCNRVLHFLGCSCSYVMYSTNDQLIFLSPMRD